MRLASVLVTGIAAVALGCTVNVQAPNLGVPTAFTADASGAVSPSPFHQPPITIIEQPATSTVAPSSPRVVAPALAATQPTPKPSPDTPAPSPSATLSPQEILAKQNFCATNDGSGEAGINVQYDDDEQSVIQKYGATDAADLVDMYEHQRASALWSEQSGVAQCDSAAGVPYPGSPVPRFQPPWPTPAPWPSVKPSP